MSSSNNNSNNTRKNKNNSGMNSENKGMLRDILKKMDSIDNENKVNLRDILKKMDSIDNENKVNLRDILKKMDEMDKRLTGRLDSFEIKAASGFKNIGIQIKALQKDVTELKTDVSGIKTRLDNVEFRLGDVEKDLQSYKKIDSNIQEGYLTEEIYRYMNENIPTMRINIINSLKIFYNPYDGKHLMEIDGSLRITNTSLVPKKITKQYTNNSNQTAAIGKIDELIFIEAKRQVGKRKIDSEIIQVFAVASIIKYKDSFDKPFLHENFKKMIAEVPLHTLSPIINLIFTSDYIPAVYKDYIIHINNGITEEIYNNDVIKLLRDDYRYNIIMNSNIDSNIKNILSTTTNINDIYKISTNNKQLSDYLSEYSMPYINMILYFEYIKNHLGYFTSNEFVFPRFGIYDTTRQFNNSVNSRFINM